MVWNDGLDEDGLIDDLSRFPKNLGLYDTTLRDGEQSIGVVFSPEEKIELAKMLENAGVNRIEAGLPLVSSEDAEAIRVMAKTITKAELWGFARCRRQDVEACVETGVSRIICEIPASPYKLRAYGRSEQWVREQIKDVLPYAKDCGLYVGFFAVDATRTPTDFLEAVYKTAVNECGADEVVVVDTVGIATPEKMSSLTQKVIDWVANIPVSVHCHNEFGLATACTLSGVKAGAQYAHVTVNGLGEKSGNADLAEIVMAAELLYGIQTAVDKTMLFDLSKKVSELSNVVVSPQKPVVGADIFKRESGGVIAQIMQYPPAVEAFDPGILGREREVVLGKKSGKASVEYMLERMNIEVEADMIPTILQRLKELSSSEKRNISAGEFLEIVRSKDI